MATSLILALIAIASLGILALVMIFFGGAKKRDDKKAQEVVAKKVKPVKMVAVKKASKLKEDVSQDENEPYFSDPVMPVAQEVKKQDEVLVDPTLASLGFSAIDDLLAEPESLRATYEEAVIEEPQPKNEPKKNTRKTTSIKKTTVEQDVIVLYILAQPGQPFVGYELIQSLLAAGLRFGEMDIFHYYSSAEETSTVLFSLSSAVEPGIFDVSNVGAIVCPGLSMFMRISATEYPEQVFNLMLETAQQLAEDLGGQLCDHTRQPLTIETITEYQNQLNKIYELVN